MVGTSRFRQGSVPKDFDEINVPVGKTNFVQRVSEQKILLRFVPRETFERRGFSN